MERPGVQGQAVVRAGLCVQVVPLHSDTSRDSTATGPRSDMVYRKTGRTSLRMDTNNGQSIEKASPSVAVTRHRHRVTSGPSLRFLLFFTGRFKQSRCCRKLPVQVHCKHQRTKAPVWSIMQLYKMMLKVSYVFA